MFLWQFAISFHASLVTHHSSRIIIAVTAPQLGLEYPFLFARMAGYTIVLVQAKENSAQETARTVKGYDGVIVGGQQYDRYALENLKDRLRIIAKFGSGYDNIDVSAATKLGIAVTNAPGTNSLAVAEHALAMMLCLTRKICCYDRQIRQGMWQQDVTSELYGKTVGIIGFGNIGQWLAKLLKGFSCRILVYDPAIALQQAASFFVESCQMEELVRESDFISLHLPLTPETERIIGMDFFKKMKRSAFLINTSRGKIVREEELVEALRNGIIAGAGLDVYDQTPLNGQHPLCKGMFQKTVYTSRTDEM